MSHRVTERSRAGLAWLAAVAGRLQGKIGQQLVARPARHDSVAIQVQRTEQVWRHIAETWGMLTVEQVAIATGGDAATAPVHVAELERSHGLLGVRSGGEVLYPAWQLTAAHRSSGRAEVNPSWDKVQAPLTTAGWSPAEILLWAASPSGRLDGGARPADLLRKDPAAVIGLAITVASGLS